MIKRILNIFGNGLPWGVAFFAISFCIGYFNSGMTLKDIFPISAAIALLALIVNGSIYSRFTKPLKILERIEIKIPENENLMISAPANHLIDGDIMSGKLFLTDKKLIFKTHQLEEFVWTKSELHTIVFYPSFKNKGGEFTLKEKNDRKLMFEVNQLKSWKSALQKKY
ncbi:MAG: hypothetical protein PSV16_11330 [Flavobacterium sp.]|nr:hypothetical protein [Flavobacterium sp.]